LHRELLHIVHVNRVLNCERVDTHTVFQNFDFFATVIIWVVWLVISSEYTIYTEEICAKQKKST